MVVGIYCVFPSYFGLSVSSGERAGLLRGRVQKIASGRLALAPRLSARLQTGINIERCAFRPNEHRPHERYSVAEATKSLQNREFIDAIGCVSIFRNSRVLLLAMIAFYGFRSSFVDGKFKSAFPSI